MQVPLGRNVGATRADSDTTRADAGATLEPWTIPRPADAGATRTGCVCRQCWHKLEVFELSGELRHAEKISGIEIIAVFLLIFLIFTNCKQYNSNDRQ